MWINFFIIEQFQQLFFTLNLKKMKLTLSQVWATDLTSAKQEQLRLAHQIRLTKLAHPIRFIAGADVAYSRKLNLGFAAVSIFNFPAIEMIEQQVASAAVKFPYVPGYLTFREAPVLLRAFEKIERTPDLLLFDGQGTAHPRKMGIATHLGILLDLPSIGCAKSRLVGEYDLPAAEKGSSTELLYRNEKIGAVVRTRAGTKPVFVSPGFKITHEEAVNWVKNTCTQYRIPEPIRQSHIAVGKLRQQFESAMLSVY